MESAQHREGNRQRVRTEGRWYKGHLAPRFKLLAAHRSPHVRAAPGHRSDSTTPHARRLRPSRKLHRPESGGYGAGEMDSEQTTEQTFRVTSTPDGRSGVTVFVDGKPGVVLWLDSKN